MRKCAGIEKKSLVTATDYVKNKVTVQQHRICFVSALLTYRCIAHRPLSRLCGTAEQLRFRASAHSFG